MMPHGPDPEGGTGNRGTISGQQQPEAVSDYFQSLIKERAQALRPTVEAVREDLFPLLPELSGEDTGSLRKTDGTGRSGLLRRSTGKVWSRHTGNVREQPRI